MMETILIFTNKTELSDYSLSDLEITTESKFILKRFENTDKKQIIFAYDEIGEADLQSLIDKIPVGNIYILYHSKPNETIISNLKSSLLEKEIKGGSIHILPSAHSNANTYGLIKKIETNGNGNLNEVFESFKLAIAGNPYLESLIRYHKTLSNSQINNHSFNVDNLKQLDKYKLAFELLESENNIEKSKVESILNWTSSKIIELSN